MAVSKLRPPKPKLTQTEIKNKELAFRNYLNKIQHYTTIQELNLINNKDINKLLRKYHPDKNKENNTIYYYSDLITKKLNNLNNNKFGYKKIKLYINGI